MQRESWFLSLELSWNYSSFFLLKRRIQRILWRQQSRHVMTSWRWRMASIHDAEARQTSPHFKWEACNWDGVYGAYSFYKIIPYFALRCYGGSREGSRREHGLGGCHKGVVGWRHGMCPYFSIGLSAISRETFTVCAKVSVQFVVNFLRRCSICHVVMKGL